MLKCPYCSEERPNRSRLQTHVDQVHYFADTQPRRADAVNATADRAEAVADHDDTPRCTCGARVDLGVDSDGNSFLVHVYAGNDGCTVAQLNGHEPTPQQREDLQAEWARVGTGLNKAGQEMREMRAALDAVDERMRKLDAELTKPSVVRRATLNQVWDKLLDAGHLAAAREVMKMIERVVD